MMLKKMLCLLIGGLFSLPLSTNAAIVVLEESPEEIITLQQTRLDSINSDFTLFITSFVTESFLSTQQAYSYQRLICSWESKIQQTAQDLVAGKNIDDTLLALELFVEDVKKTHFILQLLTRKNDTLSLSTRQYQQMLVDICWELSCSIESNVELYNSKTLGLLVETALEGYLDDVVGKFLLTFDRNPLLAEGFLKIALLTQSNKFSQNKADAQESIHRITHLITILESKIKQLRPGNNESFDIDVLDCMIIKLLGLRKEIVLNTQLAHINQQHTDHIDTFIKHFSLVHDDNFDECYQALTQPEQNLVDEYDTTIQKFFFSKTDTLYFDYTIKLLLTQCEEAKAHYDGGKLKQWTWGTGPASRLFTHITEVLKAIKQTIDQKQEVCKKKRSSIAQTIFSGEWLTNSAVKKISQSSSGHYILEFAQDFLETQSFDDAKSAALYALAYASPVLLPKIIDYMSARHTNTGNLIENSAIIEFANKNPDILKELNDRDPEILDLLAQSLKNLAQKST